MNDTRPTVPFAQQRIVFLALIAGMVLYVAVVVFLLQTNGGSGLAETPVPLPDTMVTVVAGSLIAVAFGLRTVLRGAAGRQQDPARRARAAFAATLAPLAMIEGACLLATTMWMLSGSTVPHAITAVIAILAAITIVPFTDPEAATR
jgi:hypothetical protein